jgi:hypothetical protein
MQTTATKSVITDWLADLFARAKQAALDADPGDGPENDGGTCNLDTPAFRAKGCRSSVIQAAAERAGLSVSEFHWFGGKRWWWLHVPLLGQANRRATMAEAAARVLREAAESGEWPAFGACLYCQMD